MTKNQLIDENDRLTRELAKAVAANAKAMECLKAQTGVATYRIDHSTEGVPVPLTDEQEAHVRRYLEDSSLMSDCAGGYGLNQSVVVEPWREALLPNFTHYIVKYDYDRDSGISINGVWGLSKVRA